METKTLPVDVCVFGCFGRLSLAAVQFSWLLIWFRRKVVNPCFIHCHIFKQKLFFVTLKQLQTMLWFINVLFLIDAAPTLNTTFSLTNVLLSDIFNSSAILWNFNLWSTKMSLWSFQVFSGTTAKFGQPEHSASFVSVRPCLKSAYHFLTIVSDGAEPK